MARRNILYGVGLALLLPTVHSQGEIEFIYNTQVDTCTYKGITGGQGNLTANGGLCAYDPYVGRLYSCWIGVQCWAGSQTCEKGAEAGDDQILCNDNSGDTWCCRNTEDCTTGENQINVCTGTFANPNGGNTSVEEAVSKEYKALGITTVASTLSPGDAIISASATPFTTSSFTTGTTSTTSTSSSSSSPAVSSSTSTYTSAASATAAPTLPPAKHSSGVSGGAIAGIVVGVLLAVALTAIFWLLLRRKKREGARQWLQQNFGNTQEAPDTARYEAPGHSKPIELGDPDIRTELA